MVYFLNEGSILLACTLPNRCHFWQFLMKMFFFSKLRALDWVRWSPPTKFYNRPCLTFFFIKIAFPPMVNSDHIVFPVCINFPFKLFFCRLQWFFDHLRDVLLEAMWMWPGWNWCISLFKSIRLSLIHFHGFQLPVLLP